MASEPVAGYNMNDMADIAHPRSRPALSPGLTRLANELAKDPRYVALAPGEEAAPDRYIVNHYFDLPTFFRRKKNTTT
jgi:hypothetical protein